MPRAEFGGLNHMLRAAHKVTGAGVTDVMTGFDRTAWLVSQIHCHEAKLRGYLRRFFNTPCDVTDCVQESYARLLSLPDADLVNVRCPHAFLFTTARNVALEWLRKQRVLSRSATPELDLANIEDNAPTADEQLCSRQELELLAFAVASLPERCRQVLTMRKLDGVSQKDIAVRLHISENTVEKHARNGVRLCAEYIDAQEGRAYARHFRAARCAPPLKALAAG
jgi:RNA polymerase sigma factor (sigma-70 family)